MVGGRKPRSVDMRILLALTCLALTGPLAAQTYAIRAGTLIDPARGAVEHDQVLVVADGHIKAIGPHPELPPGATPIDLSREWLMPGQIDAHTHLTLTDRKSTRLNSSHSQISYAVFCLKK